MRLTLGCMLGEIRCECARLIEAQGSVQCMSLMLAVRNIEFSEYLIRYLFKYFCRNYLIRLITVNLKYAGIN
jgi:hypothetical protein